MYGVAAVISVVLVTPASTFLYHTRRANAKPSAVVLSDFINKDILYDTGESISMLSVEEQVVCTKLKFRHFGEPQRTQSPIVIRAGWSNYRDYIVFFFGVEEVLLHGYIVQASSSEGIVGQFYKERRRKIIDCYPGLSVSTYTRPLNH